MRRASGSSSIESETRCSGPNSPPAAIRNTSEYPILPAAPETATRTGSWLGMNAVLSAELSSARKVVSLFFSTPA